MDLLDMDLFGGAPAQPTPVNANQIGDRNQVTGADDIFGDFTGDMTGNGGNSNTSGAQGNSNNNQAKKTDDIFDLF
jgi:hypothetical protein